MLLRRFNRAGMKAFGQFLADCRQDPALAVPAELLENPAMTVPVTPNIPVEHRPLITRMDAAHYFTHLLDPLPQQEVAEDDRLWTWLTLLFFDDVCPPRDGRRTVRNDYHYIFEPHSPRHWYRHLLFIAWRIISLAPEHNRLMLKTSLANLDEVTTQILKRLYLTRIPCMFEVLDRLYWDPKRKRARTGIASPGKTKPGDLVHRLPLRIRQLEKTYDLQSLNADQLIQLLGAEFQPADAKRPATRQRELALTAGAAKPR